MQQARYWIITINDSDQGHSWTPPTSLPAQVVWIRGQKEIGTNTHRPHWQLSAIFSRGVRLAMVKQVFGANSHCEPTRSQAAEAYCWKEDTRIEGTQFEIGERPFHRNRSTDWGVVRLAAQSGDFEKIPDNIFCTHYRTLRMIASDYQPKPPDLNEPCGIWIYGPSGVGKSSYVRKHYGHSLYMKGQNKWWDGYTNETSALIDDFDCNVMSHYLKIWADQYAFQAEIKGGKKFIRPKNFIVTSNFTIRQLHSNMDDETIKAIERRFFVIYIPLKMY